MKILFLSLIDFSDIDEPGIYTDLLREFDRHGHEIYVVSPRERRVGGKTCLIKKGNVIILKLRIGNIQKTNIIEKGISTLLLEHVFIDGIKKYFNNIRFDLILYPTPPITIYKVVQYVKKRDRANSYLLLKDIFPQNAVDLGMLSTGGIKAPLYLYFRAQEKKLYAVSDRIGCMSPANVDYLIRNNPTVDKSKVEVCPNSVDVVDKRLNTEKRLEMRKRYGLPQDKVIFVYGGNLGRPQGIDFLICCLEKAQKNHKAYFLIVGDGTEYKKLEKYIGTKQPKNVKLMKSLPKDEYDSMIAACDVGMVFLDHRFTIPNFPSRLLSYLQSGLPVLACTDPNTDVGRIIVEGGFGWWCESDDDEKFEYYANFTCAYDLVELGERGYQYLLEHYDVRVAYKMIIHNFEEGNTK